MLNSFKGVDSFSETSITVSHNGGKGAKLNSYVSTLLVISRLSKAALTIIV